MPAPTPWPLLAAVICDVFGRDLAGHIPLAGDLNEEQLQGTLVHLGNKS